MTIKAEDICKLSQSIASVHTEKEGAPRRRHAKEKVVLSWSGGKDSTMAAYHLLASQRYEIAALMTTVTEEFDRISMHGVRRELLERQAESLGIPLRKIMIPKDCPNEVYEARMRETLSHFKAQGITKVAFGDLFLEDLKQYRDERLAQVGMTGIYPIWMRDTEELVRTFIGLGFKAILACVDTKAIDAAFAGREIDHDLLRDLPESADPCGEHGEYHSFVYAGPIFKEPVACKAGERVMRTPRFNYCDIVPV
jgi:uncharacterized protein (TIGR00290 family)